MTKGQTQKCSKCQREDSDLASPPNIGKLRFMGKSYRTLFRKNKSMHFFFPEAIVGDEMKL